LGCFGELLVGCDGFGGLSTKEIEINIGLAPELAVRGFGQMLCRRIQTDRARFDTVEVLEISPSFSERIRFGVIDTGQAKEGAGRFCVIFADVRRLADEVVGDSDVGDVSGSTFGHVARDAVGGCHSNGLSLRLRMRRHRCAGMATAARVRIMLFRDRVNGQMGVMASDAGELGR